MSITKTAFPDSYYEIHNELLKIEALVATARTLIEKGKLVDISMIENKVRFICEKISESPVKNKNDLCVFMEKLLKNMDFLAEDLHKHHSWIENIKKNPIKSFWNINKETEE